MISLCFISTSMLPINTANENLIEIVQAGEVRNKNLSITGAIIYTVSHFAMILEGDSRDVDKLMKSICADCRHRDVCVVDRHCISKRDLENWSMAYSGKATFIQKSIENCLLEPGLDLPVIALRNVITQFAKAGGVLH